MRPTKIVAEIISHLTVDGPKLRDGRLRIEAEADRRIVVGSDARQITPLRVAKALEDARVPFDGVQNPNRALSVDEPLRE
jgi:hypothetical protein